MAKNDSDLFNRMREAGLRKQVAKSLSGIGEGASKKAVRAAQGAVGELRSLADEIERRLPRADRDAAGPANPGASAEPTSDRTKPTTGRARSTSGRARSTSGAARSTSGPARTTNTRARSTSGAAKSAGRRPTGSAASTRGTARSNAAGATAGRGAQRATAQRQRATTAKPARAAVSNGARAPRGQNKAAILESLKGGPKTASEIAAETGIGTGTVGSTLTKMALAGDVVKADRGYGLPK